MLKYSLMGGLAGFIAEYWYFKDYWQPPALFDNAFISLEDFLFGFSITGVASTVYSFVFPVAEMQMECKRKRQFGIMFLVGVLIMFLFNTWLGFNSIIVSTVTFMLFSGIMVYFRRDLMRRCLMSGLFSLIIIIPVYSLIFNLINPYYWQRYWLLADTSYGLTVLGNIPVTELVWYFTWGCLVGTAPGFVSGKVGMQVIISRAETPA